MTEQPQPGAGEGAGYDPWAPPASGPSLEKGAPAPGSAPGTQPPVPPSSVHDQATMTSLPSAGFGPPPVAGQPPFAGPPVGGPVPPPAQGWSESAVPPPPYAPTGPGMAAPPPSAGYGYPSYPGPAQGYGWSGGPALPQNGMGTSAMVLGILSLCLFCFYGLPSIPLGIIAVVLGVKGKQRADRGEATNRGQAQAGFVMGIIGIVIGILVLTFWGVLFAKIVHDSDTDSDSDPYGSYNSAPSVSAPLLPRA